MKQTAVEWLVNHWKKLQAKGEKMTWQQVIDKKKAEMSNSTFDEISEYAATEYFNETFNTKEK